MLWLMVVPLITLVVIVVVPIALLAPAAVTGVLFPCHPRPLAWRRRNLDRFWPVVARWVLLVTAPYWVVPALAALLVLPSVVVWVSG